MSQRLLNVSWNDVGRPYQWPFTSTSTGSKISGQGPGSTFRSWTCPSTPCNASQAARGCGWTPPSGSHVRRVA
jgi:hypothetical protein